MENKIDLTAWDLDAGASKLELDELSRNMAFVLPQDYLDFLATHNGGEGFVGDNYLVIWKAEELIAFNADYQVAEFAPGIFLFGSDGGGEGYGFDFRAENVPVVRIPFVGMDVEYADEISESFEKLWFVLKDEQ
ncbi:MAG: SMI1/KNR4 family protein [Achromobacter sp.]|uniref:SMI1/KNR4 family protein n=1 Tax=Achromobacter sp. TaxID=134375 RepID=UPI0029BB502F|nr:SMI1/KNR4 family protein [Achromobacter sp.]MDX3988407.1 SMI1/KNR4 family protein [Achromobacter sp.]